MAVKDYIRERFLPHLWCAGCGHGMVLNGMLQAVEKLGMSKNEIVMVSGIGCSARITGYVDFHTLHTIHGRALAFATGVKMSRPELNLIVPMGDGDALAIGGNHFIHAARRNIDITAIVMNNRIYGMTGGHFRPYRVRVSGRQLHRLATLITVLMSWNWQRCRCYLCGAYHGYHVQQIAEIIKKAILHEGFSVVEILSQCPTYFGRKNKAGDAVDMVRWFKDNTTSIGSKAKQDNPDLIERGIFVQTERPEYCSEYDKIVQYAMRGK